jgi:uncharacterized protein YcnI
LSLKRILCALFLGSFLLAAPAYAHVSVSSDSTEPGAEVAVLTFHVPTESATASTTKLAIQVPKFDTVDVLPMAGWTFTTKKSGDTVNEIDWTASAAAAIKPGEFGDFSLRVGPLPKADEVSFGAVQTYSDGSTVAWNQTPAPGSDAEPDHPKPTLTLAAAPAASAAPKAANTTGATVLSIVALVVAALALGVAVVGNARRRAS